MRFWNHVGLAISSHPFFPHPAMTADDPLKGPRLPEPFFKATNRGKLSTVKTALIGTYFSRRTTFSNFT